MLSQEEKDHIVKEHISTLENRHRELVKKLEEAERQSLRTTEEIELDKIRREEEDAFFTGNPDYVKYIGHDGKSRWITKEEFEKKKYRRKKVRRRHERSFSRKLWERFSIFVIIIGMVLAIIFAFKLVGE